MGFASDFLWGAATAAYQIEGAAREDGKGESVWDAFCRRKGRVFEGHTGDVACDHYHLFREDVRLMASLGIRNYRLSISWPRVMPEGTGDVNPAGMRFYQELMDALRENGIRPFVTLYHWDMPQSLESRGGWRNPESPRWFASFTRTVAEGLRGRCDDFITINEPQCAIGLSNGVGEHAPGNHFGDDDLIPMAHHLLMAHGLAVRELRDAIAGVRVGYAPCSMSICPASESQADVEAARRAYFAVSDKPLMWNWGPAWFSDPAILGEYPQDGLRLLGKHLPPGWERDLSTICQPLDVYQQNIYQGMFVRAADTPAGFEVLPRAQGCLRAPNGWVETPEALYWGPKFLCDRYKLPLMITENGCAAADSVADDGRVYDVSRMLYLARYLRQYRRLAEEGYPLAGYFVWSLLDNFEWARGYGDRFGIVYVDYETQRRVPKESAYFYQRVMETNGASLDEPVPAAIWNARRDA